MRQSKPPLSLLFCGLFFREGGGRANECVKIAPPAIFHAIGFVSNTAQNEVFIARIAMVSAVRVKTGQIIQNVGIHIQMC